jgi:hypothetical protein
MTKDEESTQGKAYHYWDFNGQLTARLNQMFVVCGGLTVAVIVLAGCLMLVYRRLEQPPIFHVHPNGEVTVAGARSDGAAPRNAHFLPTAELPPDEVEIKHFLRTFLKDYLSYTPATADANFALAFNMMTVNLRTASLKKMREGGDFLKIQEQRMVSNFLIIRIDPVRDVNLAYTILGVRELHHLDSGQETVSKIVAHYNLRLAPEIRTEYDASGLRVAEFWEEQVMGEQNNQLNQPDDLTHDAATRQVQSDASEAPESNNNN